MVLKSAQLLEEEDDVEDAGTGGAAGVAGGGVGVGRASGGGGCAGAVVGVAEAEVGVVRAASLGADPDAAAERRLTGTSVWGILSA